MELNCFIDSIYVVVVLVCVVYVKKTVAKDALRICRLHKLKKGLNEFHSN